MALRNLVENQCGEDNALMKLKDHVTQDKTHKAYKNNSWNHRHHDTEVFGAQGVHVSSDQLVNEFLLNENAAFKNPQSFRMDSLLQEMQELDRPSPMPGPGVAALATEANTWAREYFDSEAFNREVLPSDLWANEFMGLQHQSEIDPETLWNEALQRPDKISSVEDPDLAQAANNLLGTVDDPKFSNTEFMSYMKRLGGSDAGHQWANEFAAQTPTPQTGTQKETDPSVWEKEFVQDLEAMKDGDIDSEQMTLSEKEDFWQNLQNTWEKAATNQKESDHPWFHEFEDQVTFKDYTFKEDNPLRDHPDPLAEGKNCLENGDLPSAVLLFEAAVQKDDTCAEAWILLGTTHAHNEQDPAAIPALRKGLEIEPSDLNGWMALATCYTNESYQSYACQALKDWMRNNDFYKHLIGPQQDSIHPKVLVATLAPREMVEEVRNLYLRAANLKLSEGVDCDVQCGLGILLNLTGEYDKAIDCFQSSLQVRPKDSKLWNKLGATLANSSRSAEAIDAYRSALEISPGFIRCRYNLGVACINLGAHREAMEHFLGALNMQERGTRGSKGSSLAVSDNIWSTLRVCLKALNQQHLMSAVHNRDLPTLNKEFGGSSQS